jgi:hypothetical protein
MMEEARARERHRHWSGGQKKALDPNRPIREAFCLELFDLILFRKYWLKYRKPLAVARAPIIH